MRRLTLLVLAALAVPAAAHAHGDAIIRGAASALESKPVYVHPQAIPTLTADEAAELRSRIAEAGGGIAIAVLPADALHEARDAETVVERIRARVGRTGAYAVVAGGRFAATSTEDDLGPAEGARLARDAYRERKSLAPTLYTFVELVRAERADERPPGAGDDSGTNWLLVVAAALALVGIVLLAPALRGLGSTGTMRRARRRSSVG